MAGPVGQGPFILPLPSVADALLSLIRPGQVVQGNVVGKAGELSVVVAGRRFPLGDAPTLRPGMTVDVRIVQTERGPQLHVTPRSASDLSPSSKPVTPRSASDLSPSSKPIAPSDLPPSPKEVVENQGPARPNLQPSPSASSPQPPSALDQVIEAVLRALQGVLSKGQATALLPPNLPPNPRAVSSLLNLFVVRGTIGGDLEALIKLVNDAVAGRALSLEIGERFVGQLRLLLGGAGARSAEALAQLERLFKTSVEARIARFIVERGEGRLPAELRTHLVALLSALENDADLLRFLESTGRLTEFRGAAERIMDRVMGGQLQNLQSPELPYLFLEVPMPAKSAIRSLQLHIFGDGSSQRGEVDGQNNTIVFDLSTVHLGAMWIRLAIRENVCSCSFKVMTDEIKDAIAQSSNELKTDLSEIGYGGVHVTASLWNGDRVEEVSRLVGGFAGLRLEA